MKVTGDISRPDDEQLEGQHWVGNSPISSVTRAEWFCVIAQQGSWMGSHNI